MNKRQTALTAAVTVAGCLCVFVAVSDFHRGLPVLGIWNSKWSSSRVSAQLLKVALSETVEEFKNTSPARLATGLTPTFSLRRLFEGSLPGITDEQIAKYLEEHPDEPGAILAVVQVTHNLDLLRQYAVKFPNNAPLQLELARLAETNEERSSAIASLRNADPDNALAPYLSAQNNLLKGDTNAAVKDLLEAETKGGLTAYGDEKILEVENLYLSVGFSPAVSMAASMSTLGTAGKDLLILGEKLLPQLQKQYTEDGDSQSAAALQEMTLNLAHWFEGGSYLFDQLAGIRLEKQILSTNTTQSSTDVTAPVTSRLDTLQFQVDEIKQWVEGIGKWAEDASEADVAGYLTLVRNSGEIEALRQTFGKQ